MSDVSLVHFPFQKEGTSKKFDIIFIHGLNGHPTETWRKPRPLFLKRWGRSFWRLLTPAVKREPDPSEYWPDWLAADFPEADVWSLGYAAASIAWRGNGMALPSRALNLLNYLSVKGLGKRPILFIVHSLGGLVAKQFLETALTNRNQAHQSLARSVAGILFLATPHSGSFMATVVSIFRTVTRANWTIENLGNHDPYLEKLSSWFRENHPFLGIRCQVLREDLQSPLGWVVSPTSANPGITGVQVTPVGKSHVQICKPESVEDQVYLNAVAFVKSCMNDWNFQLTPRLAGLGQTREMFTTPPPHGGSIQGFPGLIVSQGALRHVQINLGAEGVSGPIAPVEWVITYLDAEGVSRIDRKQAGECHSTIEGPITNGSIGLFTLFHQTPQRITFTVQSPNESKTAQWTLTQ